MEQKEVILMLSGGRDSFLSGCRLLEKQYKIKMVTYDNGCSVGASNAKEVAERIIKKYGSDCAEFLGVYKISGIVREFFFPYFNMKPEEQKLRYAGMTPSQFHCLICRTAMYIHTIWLAQREQAMFIAEGSRKDQQFVIELPGMAQERYPELVKRAGLELLLPVYELNDDWERDNELLRRGYQCKTLEPKCLIGVPIQDSVDQSVIDGVHAYYDKEILPRIDKMNLLEFEIAKHYLDSQYDELV